MSEQKDFSNYLDYVANLAIIQYKFGADVSIKGLTFNEILDTLKNLGYIKIKEIGVNVFFEKTN